MELITDFGVDSTEESLASLAEDVRVNLLGNYNLTIPPECTGFIIRCLRIKDYDPERAAVLVKNFARSTQQLYDMMDKLQPKFYGELFHNGAITVLKSRDNLGRLVVISRIAKWDPKVFDFDDIASASMLMFSFSIGESIETQRKGVVFVNDLSGFSLHHVRAIKPSRLTQLVRLMQDGSPGRIKGIHLIFHPKIFGLIYTLVKPFLKEKMASRIHFHGDDLSSLHKHIGVQALPTCYGGLLDEPSAVDQPLIDKLMKADTIHKQLKTYGVPTH